ncbi:MAG: Eco57I restriction-modification methylase domain-containing protein [Methanophagales archaeon]|nr:Eco57I restriction-modification methylase domain-containing protein [Methanophagales archaeon]
MNPANIVDNLVRDIKERLTLDGKNKVFEEGMELRSEFMKEKAEPEAFTKEFLIDKILDALGLEKLPEKSFDTPSGYRSVDYRIKSKERMFLVEAKPLNADLFEKSKAGGVNQIKGLFKLVEVNENYDFGVATDGLRWVFIDKSGKIVDDLRLEENFEQIREFLAGRERVVSPETEEEVSKKFYDWYNALLHGGRYKDHENKLKTVPVADSLVNNVIGVKDLEEKEQIAQVVMNRLIFIKFLQSKGIIAEDILKYLSEVREDLLTPRLRQLFFGILNTPEDERFDVNERFKDIPYLNGSLFVHTEVENKNVEYKIKAEILKKAIEFLDSFKFVHKEQFGNEDSIDPEILGYIFERAMTATDRKGTGAYYTPRQITRYISENTIYPYIIERTNEFLKAKKGYKDTELIEDIERLFILPATTLEEIWKEIIQEIRVLDNACGSGAFLLAAANILFELNRRIDDKLGLGNSDIALKKWILMHNLYGVDINPSGIEIAKLRLWLWLADSYEQECVEPLPNIDYNLRVGNSLIGYMDISGFKETKLNFLNYFWDEEKPTLDEFLTERDNFLRAYKRAEGEEARELKEKINGLDEKIKKLLNGNLYLKFRAKGVKISKEDFLHLKPFHWGFEFYDVFDAEKPKEEWGFDVVIGNPPYVRADAEDAEYQKQRELLERMGEYQTLYEKWDLFTAFIERSLELLGKGGMFSYIVSNSFNTSKFADKSKRFILENYCLKQIDFFKNIKVFKGVGIENVILTVMKSIEKEKERKNTRRILHTNSFENIEELEPSSDINKIFRISAEIDLGSAFENTELLGNICFISVGMVLNADEKKAKGEFSKDDLISDKPTKINKKPYVEAKYIGRYQINMMKYLEWDTDRCPAKIRRPTFSELYIHPKLIRGRTTEGIYDENGLVCNDSACTLVLFNSLERVSNRSIENSIKKWTDKPRKELEEISLNFDLKYILTILNSKFAKFYLNTIRRHRIEYYFYPDDFKRLPIKKKPLTSQQPFITLCNYMLFLNETEERRKAEKELIEFIDEQVIDSLVYELYFKEKFEDEGLKTNLLALVEPYFKDIEDLKTEEEKLKVIKEVVERIKGDRRVKRDIEEIRNHEWVMLIEGEKNAKTK